MSLLAVYKLVDWYYLAGVVVGIATLYYLGRNLVKFFQRKGKRDKHGKLLKAHEQRFNEQVDPLASTVATHEQDIAQILKRNEELSHEAEQSRERIARVEQDNAKYQQDFEKLLAELAVLKEQALAKEGLPVEPASGESAAAQTVRAEIEASQAAVIDHFTLGYEATLRKDWLEALKHYEAALARERTVAALNNIGVAYGGLERYHDELDMYDRAESFRQFKSLPEDSTLIMNRGIALKNLEKLEEALLEYDRAESLLHQAGKLDDGAIASNRGVVFAIQGDYLRALGEFNKARELRRLHNLPEDPGLEVNIGNVFRAAHRFEEAFGAFDNADRLRKKLDLPEDAAIEIGRGNTLKDLKKYDDSKLAYMRAAEIRKSQGLQESTGLLLNIANTYFAQEQFDDALDMYNRAIELQIIQGVTINPVFVFNKALVYKRLNNLATACQLACQARDMYAQHKLETPVNPHILAFIEENCPGGCPGGASASP